MTDKRLIIVSGALLAVCIAAIVLGAQGDAEANRDGAEPWVETIIKPIGPDNALRCRSEFHLGSPVVSTGFWHKCSDRELGA